MINLHKRLLSDLVGIEPTTSWSPVICKSDWATKANCMDADYSWCCDWHFKSESLHHIWDTFLIIHENSKIQAQTIFYFFFKKKRLEKVVLDISCITQWNKMLSFNFLKKKKKKKSKMTSCTSKWHFNLTIFLANSAGNKPIIFFLFFPEKKKKKDISTCRLLKILSRVQSIKGQSLQQFEQVLHWCTTTGCVCVRGVGRGSLSRICIWLVCVKYEVNPCMDLEIRNLKSFDVKLYHKFLSLWPWTLGHKQGWR